MKFHGFGDLFAFLAEHTWFKSFDIDQYGFVMIILFSGFDCTYKEALNLNICCEEFHHLNWKHFSSVSSTKSCDFGEYRKGKLSNTTLRIFLQKVRHFDPAKFSPKRAKNDE